MVSPLNTKFTKVLMLDLNGTRKYYTIEHFDDDRIVEVLIIGEEVIYTQFIPPSAEKALVRNTDIPKKNTEIIFGEF